MLDASLSAVGAAPIDYRAPDERPPDEAPVVEEEQVQPVEEPDVVPPELLVAFERVHALLASAEQLKPPDVGELESLHLLVVSGLVTQAKDARPFLSMQDRNMTLPAAHRAALRFVSEIRAASEGALATSLKWIPKNLGLNSLISTLAKDQ